jgi:beta-glucosidase
MEIQELKDNPKINSILYMGHPGNFGTLGIVDVLCGNSSPSGGLYDIFASNTMSAPAVYNVGRHTYSNSQLVYRDTWQFAGGFTDNGLKDYLMEVEGIYIGYRYYETRYYDWVVNQGNARSDAGVFDSKGNAWNYSDEVSYGFGYGMSYTSFSQTMGEVKIENRGLNSNLFVKVPVTVKNTGNLPGKSIVQLYAQAPYTDYDKENGIEKSAIQLIAYDKTRELAPGEEQTIIVEGDLQNLASYDAKGAGTWILDKGAHYFAIGNGAHDALNNILAKQGKTVADGMTENGNAKKAYEWNYRPASGLPIDSFTFSISRSGKKVENQLKYSDWNDYEENEKVTHLSRKDWEATWPKTYSDMPISQGLMLDHLKGEYIQIKTDEETSGVIFDMEGDLKFADLAHADFNDPRWAELIDQITYEEALEYAFQSGHLFASIESINFPGKRYAIDGTGGPVTNLAAGTDTSENAQNAPWAILPSNPGWNTASSFNCRVSGAATVMACTFNPELAYQQGLQYGNIALFTGTTILWGPAPNIHRHQYNGRNLEYFSEDPVLSGNMSMDISAGALKKGLISTPKHFAFNDQEIGRAGIAPFMTEQRAREIDLRAFQITFEGYKYNGKATLGTMLSFSKLGGIECTAHSGLLTEILRNEWGFNGYVVSDYKDDFDLAPQAFKAGMTGFIWNNYNNDLKPGIDKFSSYKDVELLESLKDIAHRELFVFANSNQMNFVNTTSRTVWIMTWWRQIYISVIVVFSAFIVISIVLYSLSLVLDKKVRLKTVKNGEVN